MDLMTEAPASPPSMPTPVRRTAWSSRRSTTSARRAARDRRRLPRSAIFRRGCSLNRSSPGSRSTVGVLFEAQIACEPVARAAQVPRDHGVQPRRVRHEARRRAEAAGRRDVHQLTVDGRTPQQQITECYAEIRQQELMQRGSRRSCLRELHANDIRIRSYDALTPADQKAAARGLLRERLPAGHAARDRPGASVPVHLEPLAQPARHAALPERHRAAARPGQGARSGRAFPRFLRVGSGRHVRPARRGDRPQPRPAVPGDGRRPRASSSASPATPTPSATRRKPTTCWRLIESELRDRRVAPDRAPRGGVGDEHVHCAACSPPSSASTSAPTCSKWTACWRCAT